MKRVVISDSAVKKRQVEKDVQVKLKFPHQADEELYYKEGKKDKIFEKLNIAKKHFLSISNNRSY